MKRLTISAATLFLLLAFYSLFTQAQTLVCTDLGHELPAGQHLLPGNCLRSGNGRYALEMHTNGDLALYDLGSSHLMWDTGTAGRSISYAVVDSLGNLDLFDGTTLHRINFMAWNPRGSIWHRWDPHLHAPGTLLADRFGRRLGSLSHRHCDSQSPVWAGQGCISDTRRMPHTYD